MDLPLLVWQLVLLTSGACLTGRPTNPATVHNSLLMVLVGNPTSLVPWQVRSISQKCSNSSLWADRGLHHLPPVVLWSNACRIPCGAFCPRASSPQGCERSHASPVYVSLGTSHTYPETYPNGSCSCRDVDVGCCLLPGSICQYSTPACGQPLTPTSKPPWPPRGLCHVGSLSLRTGSRILFGSWAMEWPQQPPFGSPPTWQYPLVSSS